MKTIKEYFNQMDSRVKALLSTIVFFLLFCALIAAIIKYKMIALLVIVGLAATVGICLSIFIIYRELVDFFDKVN